MDGNHDGVSDGSVTHYDQNKALVQLPQGEVGTDYLPPDILKTLLTPTKPLDDLGPGAEKKKGKKKKNASISKDSPSKRPVDCVWHHEAARNRFQHLVDQAPCTCGAGGDISFLCDAPAEKKRHAETNENTHEDGVPDSLIPSEFHIIKSKGVVGLEVHDSKYTTTTADHEKHRTIFPSMKPASRQEAIQLLNTMDTLLKKAGVSDISDEASKSIDEESSSHIRELLKIVRDEQNIYNIVFNEIIRQVSIECVERGSVLAKLRKRYASLLDRIPKQVKNLHEEVLAQRALDRRLTEELSRFKTSVSYLTQELHEVQEHDRVVTKQAVETQKELTSALKESEKNASLLAEYHDLYELQRRRLDRQIGKLIEERDLWSGCAYMLSTKVAEKHDLVTAKRMHLHERAWCKLASYFIVLLGEHDGRQLQALQQHVRDWQDIVESFDESLRNAESQSVKQIKKMRSELEIWSKDFSRVVTPDEGTVHPPAENTMQRLFETFKSWEELLNAEAERFQGEALLACEDGLLKMQSLVDSWTLVAQKLFAHHPMSDPSQDHPQNESMNALNKQVEEMHKRYRLRMSGENGIASSMIHIINSLDTWTNKLNTVINGGDPLFESEWIQLADFLQSNWIEALNEIITLLEHRDGNEDVETNESSSPDANEQERNSGEDVDRMFQMAQKWLSETTNSIENQDSNFNDQLLNVHTSMVRWMITIILRLAPDMPTKGTPPAQPDGGDIAPPSAVGLGAAILAEATAEAIQEKYDALTGWIQRLTLLVFTSVKDLVKGDPSSRDEAAKIQSKQNVKDLQRMKTECTGWISMAKLLINILTGEEEPQVVKAADTDIIGETGKDEPGSSDLLQEMELMSLADDDSRVTSRATTTPKPTPRPQSLQGPQPVSVAETEEPTASRSSSREAKEAQQSVTYVIGHDDNVKQVEGFIEAEPSLVDMMSKPASAKGEQALSAESLNTLQALQEKLLETEARAQSAENRAFQAESDLAEVTERLKATEKVLERTKKANKKSKDKTPEKPDMNRKSSQLAANMAKKYSGTTTATPVGPVKKSSSTDNTENNEVKVLSAQPSTEDIQESEVVESTEITDLNQEEVSSASVTVVDVGEGVAE